MDELTSEFVAETRETLERVGEALIAWEANPGQGERLDEIFRFVHTVKGSCGFLDLPRIEALAHAAETALGEVRDGERITDGALVGAMLAIIDRIALLTEALESGATTPDAESDERLIAGIDEPVAAAEDDAVALAPMQARNVRVAVDLLETMMNQVSDLVLARNEMARHVREGSASAAAETSFDRMSLCVGDMRETIARTRMQPIERLFALLPRLVRDTAGELGKDVRLIIEGGDVEIDREMIEQIRDPLTHIVRNAIDHGLEDAGARKAAGKAATGSLTVSARQAGNQVSITVSDDGRGVDVERLTAKAVAAKVIDARTAAGMSPEAAIQLIFAAGLSTAEQVTSISGRGVGMDVVRANVERLGGTIVLENRPGAGLSITLRAPLTLSIMHALLVEAGGQIFALPRTVIDEVIPVRSAAVRFEAIGDGHVAVIRGEMLSVVPLAGIFGLGDEVPTRLAIVNPSGGCRYALAVGTVCDHEELVVRPIAPQLASLGVFAGQTLPDSGIPILLIDPVGIAARADLDKVTGFEAPSAVVPMAAASQSILHFSGLDGVHRAIRSAQVERIVDVPAEDFAISGGQAFAALGGTLTPALLDGALPASGPVAVLRLRGSDGLICYPVSNVHDMIALPAIAPVENGVVEGLILIEDVAVELLTWPRATPARTRKAA